jgi:hypothetical protein
MKYKLDMKNPSSNLNYISLQRLPSPRSRERGSGARDQHRKESIFFGNDSRSSSGQKKKKKSNAAAKAAQAKQAAKAAAAKQAAKEQAAAYKKPSFLVKAPQTLLSTSQSPNPETAGAEEAEDMSLALNNRFNTMRGTMKQPRSSDKAKRTSLIAGKQVTHATFTKRNKRYRRLQMSVYNFLERPSGPYALTYQLTMYKLKSLFKTLLVQT